MKFQYPIHLPIFLSSPLFTKKPPSQHAQFVIFLIALQVLFMSQSSIPEREAESYQDFAYRFQLAEGLPCDERGIILIGNTRAGKSTLALAMSGAAMKVVYDCGQLTYLNPSDRLYRDVVRNTQQSVTEQPNFYPRREGHNRWAIVDMPGHADSSRLRELINFHYIRTMAANLGEVRFLIVVTLQHRNGRFVMPEKELQMLNSFRVMFPNCGECVNIVINRVQNVGVNTAPACACFRETVMQAGLEISAFYGSITNNKIHVIERPPYLTGRQGEEQHEAPYNAITRRMQEIGNSDAQFMRLSDYTHYSPNVFREDNLQNAEFFNKLMGMNARIGEGVEAAGKVFKEALGLMVRAVLREGRVRACEGELVNIFDIFLGKYSIDTEKKRQVTPIAYDQKIILEGTKILQLLSVITEERFVFNMGKIDKGEERGVLKEGERYCKLVANHYCSKLLQIVEITFGKGEGKGELYERVMEFYLFLLRKIDECYFIAHILHEKLQVSESAKEVGLFYNFQQFGLMGADFVPTFESLVEQSINFSLQGLFKAVSASQYDQLKGEIFDNFSIIEACGSRSYGDKEQFGSVIVPQMQAKREEVSLFVVLNSEPATAQEAVAHIEKLLRMYGGAQVGARVAMVQKMARLLEQQKQYKHALVLCVHLSLNEDALRLLNVVQPTLNRDGIGRFFSDVASEFEENGMLSYAQRTLEMAKRNSTGDLDRFIEYERRILCLNDASYTARIIQRRLEAKSKEGFWNWPKINDQILFLKQKFRLKDQSPSKSIMLKNYR